MSVQVKVPVLPESVADATVAAWHKEPGEFVHRDDNLVDLETDKVVLEVPAPENGILKEVLQPQGATVSSGNVLAVLDTEARETAEPASKLSSAESKPNPEPAPAVAEETPLSPAVRRLVTEHHLDPAAIQGTGKDGRITKKDVLDHLAQKSEGSPAAPEQTAQVMGSDQEMQQASPQPAALEPPLQFPAQQRPEQRVPMTRLRARIAERLLSVQQNAAMLTTFNEVNLQKVMELRKQYKGEFEQEHGIKLGLMSFFVKASIEALKRFPVVNASVDKQDIIYHGYYDIGIAVATDRGLVVPILRDADRQGFAEIEKQIARFGEKARSGQLSIDELEGGTFTITNGGIFGSLLSTPILNPPQSAILGMHTIQQRPVADDGQIVIRPMMYLALTYDHRLVDGRDAVRCLVTIKKCLEQPYRLLFHV